MVVKRILVFGVFAAVFVAACGGASDTGSPSPSVVSTSTSSTTGTTSSTTTRPATSTSEHEAEGSGAVLLGAYVEPRGAFTDEGRREAVLEHEATIGRTLDVVNEFFSFDKPWAIDRLEWHIDSGRGLMISWNGTHADSILDGDADEVIRQRARWTAELAVPLLLRFFWEPDAAKGNTWGYHDDPTRYHDVWNYVRAIFAEEGADNAKWVWTPTTWHFVTGNAPAFYPGDDVVDVIGADGYLWSPCQGGIESATDVFGAFLDWANDRDKPVVFAEWGADEDGGSGSKAGFVEELHDLAAGIDKLMALVVFDAVDPGGRGCDWRIDSSAEALEAYLRLANDPRFDGDPGQLALL